MKNILILKNNEKWKRHHTITTTVKTNVAKISAAVFLTFDSVTSSQQECVWKVEYSEDANKSGEILKTCARLFQFQSDQHVISLYFFE